MNDVLAFTGARAGLSTVQQQHLWRLLRILYGRGFRTLLQGCAVGADEACALLAEQTGYLVEGHPSNVRSQISVPALICCDRLHRPAPPLVRNRVMVEAAALLLACPAGPEVLRSGTWSTIRHARRIRRQHWLLFPDGSLRREGE